MILLKKHIIAYSVPNADDVLEGTFIKVKKKNRFLILESVYSSLQLAIARLNFENILNTVDPILAGGNFNAKHRLKPFIKWFTYKEIFEEVDYPKIAEASVTKVFKIWRTSIRYKTKNHREEPP